MQIPAYKSAVAVTVFCCLVGAPVSQSVKLSSAHCQTIGRKWSVPAGMCHHHQHCTAVVLVVRWVSASRWPSHVIAQQEEHSVKCGPQAHHQHYHAIIIITTAIYLPSPFSLTHRLFALPSLFFLTVTIIICTVTLLPSAANTHRQTLTHPRHHSAGSVPHSCTH